MYRPNHSSNHFELLPRFGYPQSGSVSENTTTREYNSNTNLKLGVLSARNGRLTKMAATHTRWVEYQRLAAKRYSV